MTPETLKNNESRLLEALSVLPGHHERLSYVIEKFGGRTRFSERELAEAALVPGCSAPLWLATSTDSGGRLHFRARSDSPMVDGLAGLLAAVAEGCPAAELQSAPGGLPRVLQESGIARALTPTRQRGMATLWDTMRARATELATR